MKKLFLAVHGMWAMRSIGLEHLRTRGLGSFIREVNYFLSNPATNFSPQGFPSGLGLQEVSVAPEVIFVNSNPTSPSAPYRIENPATAFKLLGYDAVTIHPGEIFKRRFEFDRLRFLWSYRPVFKSDLLDKLRLLAPGLTHVIVDNDDLTFDKDEYNAQRIPALRDLSSQILDRIQSEIPSQVEHLKLASHLLASTEFLAERMSRFNPDARVSVLPFFLTEGLTEAAQQITPKSNSEPNSSDLKLVYASGTQTHSEDFAQAWPALKRFMSENKTGSLTILGYSPISKRDVPDEILHQVTFRPGLVSQSVLLAELSKFDLNLAPLDTDQAFNNAKSALKVIHAGAVGVRTLASQTRESESTIASLQAGSTARTNSDWFEMLTKENLLHLEGSFDRRALQSRTLSGFGFEQYVVKFKDLLEKLERHRAN